MIAVVQDIEQNSDLSERVASSHVLELNHLAQAFNSMLEKFQNIIADAGHVSLSSTQAAEKMAEISRLGSQFMLQQKEQITIAEQSERQLQLVETIKNTLQSIKVITDKNNKNADEAADLGQNLEQSSEKLEHIVGQFKV